MKKISLVFLLVILARLTFAQELNCFISVNAEQIQGTNRDMFNTLREAISDFMNNTTWTSHTFEVHERIECNLLFTITQELTAGTYQAKLSIQSRRPVYGSSYNTVMLNYMDEDIEFEYTEYDPLEFSELTHINNLTSILAYYAYIIIGLDYDSFSPKGGTPYFEKANKVVLNAQSAVQKGWKATESRGRNNRYWLVNNILDEGYSPLREFSYNYHRKGLDLMEKSVETGRLAISESIYELEKFFKAKPDPFMHFFKVVMDSKAQELVQIYSEAPQEEKTKIYSILTRIDPANSSKYTELQQ